MQSDPVDIVSLIVALLALIASKELASMIGPYAAILVLASAGASLSLSGTEREMEEWWEPVWYVFVRILLAVTLTVALAEVLQAIMPAWLSNAMKPKLTLVPIAFCIGWIGDFRRVKEWFAAKIDKWVDKRIDNEK